ncbi:Ig-like domain-containing protein [Shewanella olleyana]|uniref:Ig-like domain-containing protein n=1 Tax=Shewanella olleyana TaxID=135626 RepID=UPI00200F624E|nr:Ig-like domain-containing protein [Shewanella olleyana]MCL1068422.1 Ig-like domain-containing protein [Shewanella olleyana]
MKKFTLTFIAAALLVGCGGSDSTSETPKPTPTPIPSPTAISDIGIAQNNLAVTLDVLANDTDNSGNGLTITSASELDFGSVEIVDNKLVYTPEEDTTGVASFTYELTDGTNTATGDVSVTVNHTMTISGQVTDNPIANAEVTVSLGGESHMATADVEGNYSLPLTINNLDEMIKITAMGSAENEQQNVELISIVGQTGALLKQLDDQRIIGTEQTKALNATHLSTAAYLIAMNRNGKTKFTSSEEFKAVLESAPAEQILETAGFIKLLVDNSAFDIPEGETTVSLLSDEKMDTQQTIKKYLTDNELLDESGNPTEAYSQALEEAIEQTLADPKVVDSFSNEMFMDKSMTWLVGAQPGWLEFSGDSINFNASGSGSLYSKSYFSDNELPIAKGFEWSIENGKAMLQYDNKSHVSYESFQYPYTDLKERYGFSDEVVQAFVTAHDQGLYYDSQIALNFRATSDVITLLQANDYSYQVNIDATEEVSIEMPEQFSWVGDNPKVTMTNQSQQILQHTYENQFAGFTLEDFNGKWVLPIESEFLGFPNYNHSTDEYDANPVSGVKADIFTINNGQAQSQIGEQSFVITLSDEVLKLKNGDTHFEYLPYANMGDEYLVLVSKYQGNAFQYSTSERMVKHTASDFVVGNQLVTELPEMSLSNINAYQPSYWDGDQLAVSGIWGRLFKADGTFNHGIYGLEPGDWSNTLQQNTDKPMFELGFLEGAWTSAGNKVDLLISQDYILRTRHREWEVVSVDSESGRMIVIEYSNWHVDMNGDGVLEDAERYTIIPPRVNYVSTIDLSEWGEAWKNSQDLGSMQTNTTTPALNSKPIASKVSSLDKQSVKKLFVEPNN